MARVSPGVAFSLPTDLGFAVGLVTHVIPRIGALVWISEQTFDVEPDLEVASAVGSWRWPVFFPLGAYLHRKVATRVGIRSIPRELQVAPIFRGRAGKGVWKAVCMTTDGSGPSTLLGRTDDRSLPIYRVVNDIRLKEMIVSGWRPNIEW